MRSVIACFQRGPGATFYERVSHIYSTTSQDACLVG
jgi:hypothetical protein